MILNTGFGMDQAEYDKAQPQGFQSADWLKTKGQLDIVVDSHRPGSQACHRSKHHVVGRVSDQADVAGIQHGLTQQGQHLL